MIKLAGKDLKTTRPSDLNAQLVQATGCGVDEIDTILAAGPDRASRALRPFLDKDALPGPELARAIAGDAEAVVAIRKLYADLPVPATDAK